MTNSYGGKSNDALLRFYGFVDIDNPHDVYTADMADWVKTHYGVLEERWHFVEADAAAMQSLQQVCSVLCTDHTCVIHLYGLTACRACETSHLSMSISLIERHCLVASSLSDDQNAASQPVYMHARDVILRLTLFMQSIPASLRFASLLHKAVC